MSEAPLQFVQGGCELNSHPLEGLQANPCLLEWTVMDGLVPPGDPREDLGDLLPPPAAGSTCAGLCQPGQSRHRLLVSKKAEQSRAGCLPWRWGLFSLFRLPPAGSWGLRLEREPHKIPKQRGMEGAGHPFCTPACLSLLSESPALLGTCPQLAGHGGPTAAGTEGTPLRALPPRGADPSSSLPARRRPSSNPLPKGAERKPGGFEAKSYFLHSLLFILSYCLCHLPN